MKDSPKKQMSVIKRILLIVLAVPGLFIILVIGTILTSPIFDSIDKGRFETLDKQSKAIYDNVKAKSNGAEEWTYEASCSPIMSGWMTTGEYVCKTNISTEISVTTAAQVNALHEKYYPVIDSSSYLKQSGELNKQYPEQFGILFTVSSAEKKYTSKSSSGIKCTYFAGLDQSRNVFDKDEYGTEIKNGAGIARVSLDCADKARQDWFGKVDKQL